MLGFTKTQNIHNFNIIPRPIIQKRQPIPVPHTNKYTKMKIIILVNMKNKFDYIELMVAINNILTKWRFNCCLENVNGDKDYSNDNLNLYIGPLGGIKFNNLPKKYIIFNGEPITSFRGSDLEHIRKLQNATAILHYNLDDIEALKNKYNKPIFYLPHAYHYTLENIHKINTEIKEDIDVLFIGYPSIIKPNFGSHRNETLTKLKNTDLNIVVTGLDTPFVYHKERDVLIRRAKIILLINFYEGNVDTCRATHLIANKRFCIIDSWNGGETLSNIYNKILPCVNSDNLYKTIKYYLNNEEERKQIIEKGYNYVKEHFQMETFIKKIPYFNTNIRS